MSNPNYYEVLGVTKESNQQEIKKSYHKLALKYHPDKNSSIESEDMIKKINEAYSVLGDDNKRREYDMYGGSRAQSPQFHRGGSPFGDVFNFTFSTQGSTTTININELFKSAFFNFGGNRNGGGVGFEFHTNTHHQNQHKPQHENVNHNLDIYHDIYLTLEEIICGVTKNISIQQQNNVETLSVKIPKGFSPGKQLRIIEKGNVDGNVRGNLFLTSKLIPNGEYIIHGLNIIINRTISKGTTRLQLTTPERIDIDVEVPSNIETNTNLAITGHGIPHFSNPNFRGDLLIRLNIVESENV